MENNQEIRDLLSKVALHCTEEEFEQFVKSNPKLDKIINEDEFIKKFKQELTTDIKDLIRKKLKEEI